MRIKITVSLERKDYPNLKIEEFRWFIADALIAEHAKSVIDSGEAIIFSVGLLRSGIFHRKFLAGMDGGEIIIDTDSKRILIISSLRFTSVVAFYLLFLAFSLIANHFALLSDKQINIHGSILLVIVVMFLISGNIAITIYRWRQFIRQCANDAKNRYIIPKEHFTANQRHDGPGK